jgi:hypothetical protein
MIHLILIFKLKTVLAPTCPSFGCVGVGGQFAYFDTFQTLIAQVTLFFLATPVRDANWQEDTPAVLLCKTKRGGRQSTQRF